MHGVAYIFVAYVKGKGQGQFALIDWLEVPEPRRICRIENSAVDSSVEFVIHYVSHLPSRKHAHIILNPTFI